MQAENLISTTASTFKGQLAARSKLLAAWLSCALLPMLLVAAYANHFLNSFHFDDTHTIVNNAAIRGLRNIPLFFCDAASFSSLPSNQSYRPLVSTLLAIDYRIAGGVEPFWFHFSAFVLFVTLTLLLALTIHRVLKIEIASTRSQWIALVAAAWFGLHPANADTVNYIIASADVISTLGVIASFAIYLAFPRLRRWYLYALPAAVAILAKPPAAIFAVLFAVFRLLFKDSTIGCAKPKSPARTWLAQVLPAFALCGATLLFVQRMTPLSWMPGAESVKNYIITQPYVALLYLRTFFWPCQLSADYDLAALTTTDDARFWAGLVFLTAFVAVSITACISKRTRVVGFGLAWFLIALLPTSLFPLAEVMNDHRTLLPYVGLVIAGAGFASLFMNHESRSGIVGSVTAGCVAVLFLAANGCMTWQRNKVWKTEASLWHDVVVKSPRNARGLMNYGTVLMAQGDLSGALSYFHRAQALAPRYPVLLINLAIAESSTKQSAQAEEHFQEALRLAPRTPDSYTYYARWLFSQGHVAEARRLLLSAVMCSPTDLTARQLLAQTEAQPLPPTQTAEFYLALSFRHYREDHYAEAIVASQTALALRPSYAEAWNNIGASHNRLGQYEQGAMACQKAVRLKPDFDLARNNLRYARQMLRP